MLNSSDKIISFLSSIEIKDIHWKAQDADENSLLFYKLSQGPNSEIEFLERMKDAKYKWLIINRPIENFTKNVTIVDEAFWPKIQKYFLDELYPIPKLKLIGITGTNGKTTTTDLVLQIGHLVGKEGMSIGTLGVREYNKTLYDFGLTSPSFIDFRKFLNHYGQKKFFCVMEVSSHALVQDRYYGIQFDAAGWLSFSQDHLDYHKSMDEYFKAKSLILNKLKPNAKLFIPSEQQSLFEKLKSFSTQIITTEKLEGSLPLFFRPIFNRNNLEVAKAIIDFLFEPQEIDYSKLKSPDGRFYIQQYKSSYVIVDFAHTPDALDNICRAIKDAFPSYRLKVLFGCGGDRDRSKRPKMGEIASIWADEIYVTSDNPRSENPDQIIKDIIGGIKGKKYLEVTERPAAVRLAFSELKEREVLLLAGKGHEDYILSNGIKRPYSDIKEVDEFISRTKT